MSGIPELSESAFARSLKRSQRERLMGGVIESGEDVVMLRRFVGLSQHRFAEALGISVYTLRNWEQGRRRPEGSALALLRIAARHPRIVRENLDERLRSEREQLRGSQRSSSRSAAPRFPLEDRPATEGSHYRAVS